MEIVIGGYDGYEGLFKVAVKLVGQSDEVVRALRLVSPEPPLGAGLVVVVVGLVVVLECDTAAFFELLEIQTAMPTTMRATIPRVMARFRVCLRFWVFCWASRRAWRPAFWR